MHARRSIREAVAAALTGLVTTGSRVFQSRMRPQDSLPALLVSTPSEEVETDLGNVQTRSLDVEVVGVTLGVSDVDDTLDAIAEEVEVAMQASGTLGGLVSAPPRLVAVRTAFDDSLQDPVGEVSLTFRCIYFTNAGVPGTTL